jgi:plasmid stabilization system protein ParE
MAGHRTDVSEPAEHDLMNVVRYISAQVDAPVTAVHMMDAIEEALGGLADMPQRYPPLAEERLAALGYRKLIVKNHIAFFTIDEKNKVVNVERILYARRDWMRIL